MVLTMGKAIINLVYKFKELGAVISFILLMIIFGSINPKVLTIESLTSIITLASEIGVIVLGITIAIIAGEFDLSIGSIHAASGMIAAYLINSYPQAPIIGIITALLFGVAVGMLNASIVTRAKIPSFIVTLGIMWLLRGLIYVSSRGFPVTVRTTPYELLIFSAPIVHGIRTSSLWFLALAIIYHIILNNTRLGVYIQSVGGATETSRALGINVIKVKYVAFMISGLMASLSGLMALARFRTIEATAGIGYELEAIAAAVIGGTSLTGGIGSIIGSALGAITIATIRLGLIVIGAPAYWYIGFVGMILPIVAAINIRIYRKRYGV